VGPLMTLVHAPAQYNLPVKSCPKPIPVSNLDHSRDDTGVTCPLSAYLITLLADAAEPPPLGYFAVVSSETAARRYVGELDNALRK